MQPAIQTQVLRRAIEGLRAAGAGDETWTEVSRLVCTAVGADSAAIVAWRTSSHQVEAFEGFGQEASLVREYQEHYYQYDVLLENAPLGGGWQVSTERFPMAQWRMNPFFGDLLHRHRVEQVLALTLRLGDDVMAALALHRKTAAKMLAADFNRGALANLTQAAVQAFSTRYSTAHAARKALDTAMSSPNSHCYLADATGGIRPLSSQHPHDDLGPLHLARNRVWHSDPTSNMRLQHLVAQAIAGTRGAISVPGGRRATLRIEAQPLPAQAKLTASQALALLRVEVRRIGTVPDATELQTLFGLTPMQSRVLQLLCEGLPPKECAERLGCSVATVRTHIAQLFNRMRCSRQTQLVQAALLLC
jgi:DNA-binding CsgD family transcriptional regulator